MPDREAGEPDTTRPPEPEPAAEPVVDNTPDRRSFLRQLSTDAVWTAGKLAGASAALRRSIVAAGGSAIGTFEAEDEAVVVTAHPGDAPAAAARAMASTAPLTELASPGPAPVPGRDPIDALTIEQQAFLASGRRAALAVNDPAGHPLLAFVEYHWDGDLFRLPARDFTARTIDIDRDPKVGLLIDDPVSGAWVAVNGIATLVYGEQVEPEMELILSKYHAASDAARRWGLLRSAGDPLVIRVKPTRFVWRSS